MAEQKLSRKIFRTIIVFALVIVGVSVWLHFNREKNDTIAYYSWFTKEVGITVGVLGLIYKGIDWVGAGLSHLSWKPVLVQAAPEIKKLLKKIALYLVAAAALIVIPCIHNNAIRKENREQGKKITALRRDLSASDLYIRYTQEGAVATNKPDDPDNYRAIADIAFKRSFMAEAVILYEKAFERGGKVEPQELSMMLSWPYYFTAKFKSGGSWNDFEADVNIMTNKIARVILDKKFKHAYNSKSHLEVDIEALNVFVVPQMETPYQTNFVGQTILSISNLSTHPYVFP
jgi:hypothetical protein